MCIIIHKPKSGILPDWIIENSVRKNPHGMGWIDLETKEVWQSDDLETIKGMLKDPKPFIAHCRYATVGGITFENIHPFRFDFKSGNGGWLFQNGTVSGFGDDRSDSANMADMIPRIRKSHLREFLESFDSRFLIYWDSGKTSRYGKWIQQDGVFYSKKNVLDRESKRVWKWSNNRNEKQYRSHLFSQV